MDHVGIFHLGFGREGHVQVVSVEVSLLVEGACQLELANCDFGAAFVELDPQPEKGFHQFGEDPS
jgi:hypothetical protein